MSMSLRIYNSLTKQLEEFAPMDPNLVTMYTCGPTVYDYVTIGNLRTYTLADIIKRVLEFKKYNVKHVMNFTDVGHLTGDNLGDADTGEDKIEFSAEKEGKSARDIANYYIDDSMKVFSKLNLLKPAKFARATDYIAEQIDIVKKLELGGFTYETSDGVYFDTSKFSKYGELSGLKSENVEEGARVEVNPEKRNPTDFALWKLSPKDKIRWQEWDSPWGRGFPGWHLECSAMILKEFGPSIDIHVGGEDLKMVHHQNEIAQSECVTGKEFVKYWIHGAFLQIDGGKMSKSLGNAYTVLDLEEKQYSPLALRYFYMTAHYRSPLNFTWESISAASAALKKLYGIVSGYKDQNGYVDDVFLDKFEKALDDDFNMPKAVSVLWDLLKSNIDEASKITTLLKFDSVLGLDIENYVGFEIPEKVLGLARVRQEYRKAGIWDKADKVRRDIEDMGFFVEDDNGNYKIRKRL